MGIGRGFAVVVPRGRISSRRHRLAGLTVLVAFAALLGMALLPAAASALIRDPDLQLSSAALSAASGCLTDNSQTDFGAGTPGGCDLTSDPGSVQLSAAPPAVDQSNSTLGTSGVGITTTTYEGQTFTPDRTGLLTQVDVNLFCSGCTGTTPDLTLSIRATSGGLPTGADLASATIAGFSSGAASLPHCHLRLADHAHGRHAICVRRAPERQPLAGHVRAHTLWNLHHGRGRVPRRYACRRCEQRDRLVDPSDPADRRGEH